MYYAYKNREIHITFFDMCNVCMFLCFSQATVLHFPSLTSHPFSTPAFSVDLIGRKTPIPFTKNPWATLIGNSITGISVQEIHKNLLVSFSFRPQKT